MKIFSLQNLFLFLYRLQKILKTQNIKNSHAFISIYALLLALSISLVALHTMRSLAIKKEITLALYFQKQSNFYARNLKDIVLKCLKDSNLQNCQKDSLQFDKYFRGEYMLTESTITDTTHTSYKKKILLLDISISAQTLLSTHPLRYAKRYILKG